MILRIISILLVLALMAGGVAAEGETNLCLAPVSLPVSFSQVAQTDTCFPPDVITAVRDACAEIAAGHVCLGAGEVDAAGLIEVGATTALTTLDSLTSTVDDIYVLALQADLPAEETPLKLVLFGDAAITDAYEGVQPPFPTITVENGPVNILNLRAEPSEDAEIVGTMGWNKTLVADGRSADSAWFRVQDEDGTAWVYASLVTVAEGDDANTLAVLNGPITQPFQSLTLTTGTEFCGGGLLLQSGSDSLAHIEVNGTFVTISRAALLLRASTEADLTIQVLSGSADVQSNGENVLGETGSEVHLTAGVAPEVVERYAFSSITSSPIDLLPAEALTCFAGVSSGSAALYSTPGGEASGELTADSNATITGYYTADDGTIWWLVNNSAWVAGSDVETAGVCEAVTEVDPSAAQQQISQPAQQNTNTSFASNQVPAGRTIWIASTGPDNLTGVCVQPPIAQCDHLAAVTQQPDGTVTWLGQEPQPYTLYRVGDNTYTGSMYANGAHLTVTVTFTSPTSWVGSKTTVYDSDPGCTHTFSYTAVPR
jgi:Bacterial SH3 domain